MFGGFSLKTIQPASNLASTGITREFSMSELGKTGLETSVLCANVHHRTELKLIQYNGLLQRLFHARIDEESQIISLLFADGISTTIETIDYTVIGVDAFRVMKLVVDFSTMQYVRLLIDKTEYDLTPYSGFTGVISQQRNYLANVRLATRTAFANTQYCGHMIITGNEP